VNLTVSKVRGIKGVLSLPGDKSISHRAAILGAIAEGETSINSFLNTGDCLSTLRCLGALGVKIEGVGGETITVHGRGLFGLTEPADILDAGNSATTARLLCGVLVGQKLFSVMTGDDSLRGRPMGRITEPLLKMGAGIWGRDDAEHLPLAIRGGNLTGITYLSPVASAQVKSAILLAGLLAEGKTSIKEPYLSRDHTERMMKLMGADIVAAETEVTITGRIPLKGVEIDIPGDASSAAFLVVAALITPESNLTLKQVGISATRTGFIDVLKEMGADIRFENIQLKSNEPRADIVISSSKLRGVSIEGEVVPRLIDEVPVLTVAGTQAEGETVFRGVGELRVKETDRLRALASELSKLGAVVKEMPDGFVITGQSQLKGTTCSSFGDHRMAMALAVAGLVAEGETIVERAESIDISFPNFERILKNVTT
jgi:3-phosphoshikimate 1-carboxyvinyltransferase